MPVAETLTATIVGDVIAYLVALIVGKWAWLVSIPPQQLDEQQVDEDRKSEAEAYNQLTFTWLEVAGLEGAHQVLDKIVHNLMSQMTGMYRKRAFNAQPRLSRESVCGSIGSLEKLESKKGAPWRMLSGWSELSVMLSVSSISGPGVTDAEEARKKLADKKLENTPAALEDYEMKSKDEARTIKLVCPRPISIIFCVVSVSLVSIF